MCSADRAPKPVLALFFFLATLPISTVDSARGQSPAAPGRRVAVTIDDLPVNEFRGELESWRDITRRLLTGLVRNAVPAIGFSNEQKLYVDGELAVERVALLEAWLEAGLELGNHSFSHPDLHRVPLAGDFFAGEPAAHPFVRAWFDDVPPAR